MADLQFSPLAPTSSGSDSGASKLPEFVNGESFDNALSQAKTSVSKKSQHKGRHSQKAGQPPENTSGKYKSPSLTDVSILPIRDRGQNPEIEKIEAMSIEEIKNQKKALPEIAKEKSADSDDLQVIDVFDRERAPKPVPEIIDNDNEIIITRLPDIEVSDDGHNEIIITRLPEVIVGEDGREADDNEIIIRRLPPMEIGEDINAPEGGNVRKQRGTSDEVIIRRLPQREVGDDAKVPDVPDVSEDKVAHKTRRILDDIIIRRLPPIEISDDSMPVKLPIEDLTEDLTLGPQIQLPKLKKAEISEKARQNGSAADASVSTASPKSESSGVGTIRAATNMSRSGEDFLSLEQSEKVLRLRSSIDETASVHNGNKGIQAGREQIQVLRTAPLLIEHALPQLNRNEIQVEAEKNEMNEEAVPSGQSAQNAEKGSSDNSAKDRQPGSFGSSSSADSFNKDVTGNPKNVHKLKPVEMTQTRTDKAETSTDSEIAPKGTPGSTGSTGSTSGRVFPDVSDSTTKSRRQILAQARENVGVENPNKTAEQAAKALNAATTDGDEDIRFHVAEKSMFPTGGNSGAKDSGISETGSSPRVIKIIHNEGQQAASNTNVSATSATSIASIASIAQPIAKAVPKLFLAPHPAMSQLEGSVRWLLQTNSKGAEIQLHPENLGRVTVHLKIEGTAVHARVWATEASTVPLLNGHRAFLESSLKEQGLTLSSFDLQHGRGGNQAQSENNRQNQHFAPPMRETWTGSGFRQELPIQIVPQPVDDGRVELYA